MTHRTRTPLFLAAVLPLALSGCATGSANPSAQISQQSFWFALSSHCGNAYRGALVSDDARDADWQGRAMVAHWAECSEDRIAIAFHVEEQPGDWNRSRTWVITRLPGGLRLKHDHRHADGSEDAVTQYGGDTRSVGFLDAQDFPVDAESIAMFRREGLDASLTNVWRLEVGHAQTDSPRFTYQLTRQNDPTRLFRVSFDASQPVTPPPPAWGWE